MVNYLLYIYIFSVYSIYTIVCTCLPEGMKNMCSSNEFKDSLGEGPWISMDFGLFVGLLCHWCQLLQAAPTEL